MSIAADPTACIVKAEKTNGIRVPIISPIKTSTCIISILLIPAIWAYENNNAPAVNTADPIAKPLPVAAVVFPNESKASVLSLTSGFNFACSAIPPALSATGP